MDSGNDVAENLGILIEDGFWFVIKRTLLAAEKDEWLEKIQNCCKDIRNPREGKKCMLEAARKMFLIKPVVERK